MSDLIMSDCWLAASYILHQTQTSDIAKSDITKSAIGTTFAKIIRHGF